MEDSLTIVPLDSLDGARLAESVRAVATPWVAVLGTMYRPSPGWSAAVTRTSADIVCGPVLPGTFRTAWDWAYYFCEYAHAASRPRVLQPSHIVAGNVVYRRAAVDPGWFAAAPDELAWHARMIREGLTLAWSDDLAVHLAEPVSWAQYVAQRERRSRRWVQVSNPHPAAAMARILVIPLVVWRSLRAAEPRWVFPWLRALPWILAAGCARAWCDAAAVLSRRRDTLELDTFEKDRR